MGNFQKRKTAIAITQRARGKLIETQVCRYLQKQGLIFLARNQYGNGGEIDLVMQEKETLVFIEVRFRQNNNFGNALESITPQKRHRIRQAAIHYLHHHAFEGACRFDVCALSGKSSGTMQVHWLTNAFTLFED